MFLLILKICESVTLISIPKTRTPPSSRSGAFMGYLLTKNSLIVFGGQEDSGLTNDLWRFSLKSLTWEEIIPISEEIPSNHHSEPRHHPGGLTSSFKSKLFIFGGQTSSGPENDFWEFDFEILKWEKKLTNQAPSPRSLFGSTCYIEGNFEFFMIFGGSTVQGLTNDLWRMNVSEFTWTLLPFDGEGPLPVRAPVLAYFQENFYLATGLSSFYNCSSYLYQYSLEKFKWTVVSQRSSQFSCRFYCMGLVHRDQLFVFHGWDFEDNFYVEEFLKINLKSTVKVWEKMEILQDLRGVEYSLTKVNNSAYFFGGGFAYQQLRSNHLIQVDLESMHLLEMNPKITFPKQRVFHSLTLINSKLYLFGGVKNGTPLDDVWTFDITTSEWLQVPAKGANPSPRHSHAAGSEGNSFVIWGGQDQNELKDDMFLFNSMTETWTVLHSESLKPRAAKGACLVMKGFNIYLYGGMTQSNFSNELWEYNLGSNEFFKISEGLKFLAYSHCWINDHAFYVSLGMTFSGLSSNSISFFNLTLKTWHVFHSSIFSVKDMSQSVQLFMNENLITIGGHYGGYIAWNEISILGEGNKKKTIFPEFDVFFIGSASVYFKKSLFIFGGGSYIDGYVLFNAANNRLFEIKVEEICELSDCSVSCSSGTEEKGDSCEVCQPGSYADGLGNFKCKKCRSGSFNRNFGSSSSSQCLPCPEGMFSNKSGAGECEYCPDQKNCPIGSVGYSNEVKNENSKSVQPPLFHDPYLGTYLLIFQILASVPLVLLLVVVISVKRFRNKLHVIDFFDLKHVNLLSEHMIRKKTKIGGLFSILFIIGSLLFTCTSILQYFLSNIQESKGLVTLVVLESDNIKFESDILIQVLLNSYGGECEYKETCLESLRLNFTNIKFSQNITLCKLVENHSCKISIHLKNGVINVGAYISLQMIESLSYSSGIEVNLTSSSSIPDQISSVSSFIEADKNSVFIGSSASEFYFTATPSLFKSESSKWENDLTGYHISERSSPKAGNQYQAEELSSASYFNLKIFIEKSSTGLLTYRYMKQTFIFFAGSLLGTISGLFGIAGFVMAQFEKKFEQIFKRRARRNKNERIGPTEHNEKSLKQLDLTG